MISLLQRLAIFLAVALPIFAQNEPTSIVLVDAKSASEAAVNSWKADRFKGVALVLDDATPHADLAAAAKHVSAAGLELYYWIEVGRNPQMATKNPLWMASLGMHGDWLRNFPKFPEPGVGEVAKAFPWTPIVYQETFLAHLTRIEQLLKKASPEYRALFLNDLQSGPSSCGCGNIQCRWAVDYHVPSTATKLEGDDIAARFVAEAKKRADGKQIIPVWTTECSEADLPSDRNNGKPGTGFCGKVACAHSACEEIFAAQFPLLAESNPAPIALLATHTTLNRTDAAFGGGPGWVTNAVNYVHQTLRLRGAKSVPSQRLWTVIDGTQKPGDEAIARESALRAGVSGVVVARVRIEQSFDPKLIKLREK